MKVIHIKPWSLCRIMAVMYAIFGTFVGIFYTVAGMMEIDVTPNGPPFDFGYWALAAYPLIYAAIGASTGFVSAVVFNLVTRWCGGLEIETKS